MTTQVTITLSDDIYRRAERLAQLSGRDIQQVIAEKLDILLPPLSSEADKRPIQTLPNDEVLTLAESMMDKVQSARMSTLLYKQQNETLLDSEGAELEMLMEVYDMGQFRKAEALAEAIKRGLRNPLTA